MLVFFLLLLVGQSRANMLPLWPSQDGGTQWVSCSCRCFGDAAWFTVSPDVVYRQRYRYAAGTFHSLPHGSHEPPGAVHPFDAGRMHPDVGHMHPGHGREEPVDDAAAAEARLTIQRWMNELTLFNQVFPRSFRDALPRGAIESSMGLNFPVCSLCPFRASPRQNQKREQRAIEKRDGCWVNYPVCSAPSAAPVCSGAVDCRVALVEASRIE